MKRYDLEDFLEGTEFVEEQYGEYVKYTDHEAEVKHLKENDLIQEKEIIKLIGQNREMFNMLSSIYDYPDCSIHPIKDLLEKVEGKQNG